MVAITSVDIDKALLHDVKIITGARSNKDAIHDALSRVVQIAKQQKTIDSIAQHDFLETELGADTIDYTA